MHFLYAGKGNFSVYAFFLLAAFIMMFIDREKEEHESRS